MISRETQEACARSVDLSVLVVSFNTRAILRECLTSVMSSEGSLSIEVIVVDNASRDLSLEMVREEFPGVVCVSNPTNCGFAGANNVGLSYVSGKYVVLLNSDAFLKAQTLLNSFAKMEADSLVGLGGGRLVGRDGSPQPSARMFPNLTRHFLVMSGLAARFPGSQFFGQTDLTWADPMVDREVDWVPGAYAIVRTDLLRSLGFFDPRFFLYYEEVDLCKRLRQAGYKIMYWPGLEIVHLGGESSRQVKSLKLSESGSQLVLWRMRSTLLFYRKHHGSNAYLVMLLERCWYELRGFRNQLRRGVIAKQQIEAQKGLSQLMRRAWRDTRGGTVSPTQPW